MRQRAAIKKQVKAIVAQQQRLGVTSYDRAASWLIALLATIGLAVVFLFIIWLTDRLQHMTVAVPVEVTEIAENGEGGGDGRPMGGSQVDVPMDEGFVESADKTSELAAEMSDMSAAISNNAIELDDPAFVPAKRRGDLGSGGGTGGGFGDGRGLGHGHGHGGRPRNWEVVFKKGETIDSYAKTLDGFHIELGVLRDKKIYYAFHFKKRKPDTKVETNPAANEKRYWLRWTQGDLRKIDVELLQRAGIDPGDSFILKFIPPDIEADMVQKDRLKAGDDVNRIKKTRWGVQQSGDKYEFYIMEQLYKR